MADPAACRFLVTDKRVVSVKCIALKPDCLGSWRLFSER